MTPIGHFAACGVLAGTSNIISSKITRGIIFYYLTIMFGFLAWIKLSHPGFLAMHYLDWAGNLAGIMTFFFVIRDPSLNAIRFLAIIIGSQVLAGFSHAGDWLMLLIAGQLPSEGMWRPHHFFHTPLFALIYCSVIAVFYSYFFRKIKWKESVFFLFVGYGLHIVMDTLIHNFPIYWLWPFTDYGASSLASAWIPQNAMNEFGNILYNFGEKTHNPKWGFSFYTAELVVNVLLIGWYFLIQIIRDRNRTS